MKRKFFITIALFINICLVFLHIHKNSSIITLSFAKQKNEKLKQELLEKEANLYQQWQALHNKSAIKNYATNTLHMKVINLKDIKTI